MSDTFFSSADAIIRNAATGSNQAAWDALKAAATGTVVDSSTATQVMVMADNGSFGDSKQYIDRQFFTFDTSALPDGATIVSANLGVYLTSVVSTAGGSVGLTAHSVVSNSAFATSDFGLVGSTELATRRAFSGLSANIYNEWALNAAGLAAINKTGFTKLCLRTSFDIDGTLPTSGQRSEIDGRNVEFTGTSSDPYLFVTYVTAVAASDTITGTDGSGSVVQSYGASASDTASFSDSSSVVVLPKVSTPANVGDTFADTSGTLLQSHTPSGASGSGSWSKHPGSSGTDSDLSLSAAGRLRCHGYGDGLYIHSQTPGSADYSVSADFTIMDIGSELNASAAGVLGRFDPSSAVGYYAFVSGGGFGSNGLLRLYRYGGSGTAEIGSYNVGAFTSIQTHNIELVMAGTAISVKYDGVTRISVTETSITSAGRAGVRIQGQAVPTDGNGIHLDNWLASTAATISDPYETVTVTEGSSVDTSVGTIAKSGSDTFTVTDALSSLVNRITARSSGVTPPAFVGPITQITAQADDTSHKWNGVADYVVTPTGARITSFQHSYVETFNPAYGGSPGDGQNSCRIKRCAPGADPTVAANWTVVADLDKLRSGGVACSDTSVTVLSSWRGQSNVLFCNYTSVNPVLSGEAAMYAWNRYSISTDDGVTWSSPADLSDLVGFPQPGKFVADGGYYELCAARPLITSDGTIVITTYNRTTTVWTDWDFQARCYRSTDDGYTWSGPISIMPYIYGYRFDEPYTVELADGSLLCTSRVTEDTHATPYANTVMTIWASKSYDDGVTWTTPQRILGPGAQTPASAPAKWGLGNRPCVTVIDGVCIMVMRSMYSVDGVTLARASGDCFAASIDGITWTDWYDVRTGALYDFSTYQNASFHGRFQKGPTGAMEVLFSQYETDPYTIQPNYVQVFRNVFSGLAAVTGQGQETVSVSDSAGVTVGVGAITKTASDGFTVTDTSGGVQVTFRKSATEAVLVTDSSGTSTTTEPLKYRLPVSANFVSARSQTADFVSARSHTADYITSPSTVT